MLYSNSKAGKKKVGTGINYAVFYYRKKIFERKEEPDFKGVGLSEEMDGFNDKSNSSSCKRGESNSRYAEEVGEDNRKNNVSHNLY